MTLPPPAIRAEFRHGLVIGKFFPPHRGHAFLVRSAAQFCARVTVGVFDRPSQLLPLALRAEALREIAAPFGNVTVVSDVDEVPIDYADPAIWDRHVAIFRQAIARAPGPPVDAVFTSEAYGDELARRLGCLHVQLDPARAWEAVSGTAIRDDPYARWPALLPAVRERLARRVVVLGAESTGTTTTARELAAALGAPFVPEVGREYTMQKLAVLRARTPGAGVERLIWTPQDFVHIAALQTRMEREAARHGGPLLVCDTDAVATQVWQARYLGSESEAVEAVVRELDPQRLYLLTHHDGVPFEDDGLRDGQHLRAWMTERFEAVLRQRRAPFAVLRGSREERRREALAAARRFAAERWDWR